MSAAPSIIRYDAPLTVGAFMRSDRLIRGLMGPFGSGKSTGCVMEMLRRSMGQARGQDGIRRTRWAIIRNTYPELRDTTRRTFEEWIPTAKDQTNWLEQEFSFTLKFSDVEAEFMFRALDRPEHVKKLLSLELTGAWINEAREVPYMVVKMLTGRVGRYPSMRDGGPTWHGIIMDTNPPDDDSWWYRLFEEKKPANVAIFKQPGGREPTAENIGNLVGGRKYYDDLASVNPDPLWIKVHVDGQYGPTMSGRPVYPEFRDNLHVIDPSEVALLPRAEILVGADFGLTPALAIGQRDPKDGQLQIFDELVAEDLGAVRFFEDAARLLKREYPDRSIRGTGDPGGEARSQVDERTPYDVASSQGIPLVPAHTNDFTLRRDAVGRALTRLTLLGRPALVISSKCKVLRKAMNGGYCFKRVAAAGEERFRDVPDKNHFSHVAEAVQYLALGEGEDTRALETSTTRTSKQFKVIRAGRRRRSA